MHEYYMTHSLMLLLILRIYDNWLSYSDFSLILKNSFLSISCGFLWASITSRTERKLHFNEIIAFNYISKCMYCLHLIDYLNDLK